MPKKIVLFTELRDDSPAKALLDRLNYERVLHVQPCFQIQRSAIRAALAGANGLLCRPNDGIEFMPSDLEFVLNPFVAGTFSSGVDHLSAIESLPGITIKHSYGGNAAGVAELALNYAMILKRRAFTAARAMEFGLYYDPMGTRVERKHWVLIGAGEQAAHVIAKSTGLGLGRFTVYHDKMTDEKLRSCLRHVPAELVLAKSTLDYQIRSSCDAITAVNGTRDLHGAIPQADIISLHVPAKPADPVSGRPGTEGMIDQRFLGLAKDSCCLINVARGNLVQEQAVIDWLRARPNSGFASDVLDQRAERQRDPALSVLHKEYMKNSTVSDPRKRLNLFLSGHIGGSAIEDFNEVCNEVLEGVLEVLRVAVPASIRRAL